MALEMKKISYDFKLTTIWYSYRLDFAKDSSRMCPNKNLEVVIAVFLY